MEKNMQTNFELLKERVKDALSNTDLDYIKNELMQLNTPTIISGVGGSSVVSTIASKILNRKNSIISSSFEPRDFLYQNISGYKNVISCSYSGNNYGVNLSFDNDLKKYLLSNNSFNDSNVTYLKYNTTIDKEKSFISLGASLIPISILMNYYTNNNEVIIDQIKEYKYDFDIYADAYEIFSGYDTQTTSKYLESTLVESGLGLPIVHDKYSYCHGRTTLSTNYNNIAIYLNRNTEFDKLILNELPKYYKQVLTIDSKFDDSILDDYQMLVQAMYLTKFIANTKNKDLSKVDYSPLVKKLYRYDNSI